MVSLDLLGLHYFNSTFVRSIPLQNRVGAPAQSSWSKYDQFQLRMMQEMNFEHG